MRNPFRRSRAHTVDAPSGVARVDTRTKRLTKRLRRGDIAIINHSDLDRVAAEALVACQPAAVLNAVPSVSGRYPNLGPEVLLGNDIPLIDNCGLEIMACREGQELSISGGEIYREPEHTLIARGTVQTPSSVADAMEEAKAGLSEQIEAFAANTMEYMTHERDLLLNGVGLPRIHTDMTGRHVLVVVRGYSYTEDLKALRPYIREYKPIIIGVDGGADAVLDQGLTPDMIVGDMDSVSDRALTCGAEIVVHAYRDGRAPGKARVEQLGAPHVIFAATGTSEDIAMLMADAAGAELIVAVGTHVTLLEFLDKGREGMSSTFLTRLKVGGRLIDAKGVSRLYRTRISGWHLALLALAGLTALVVAIAATPGGQTFLGLFGALWDDIVTFLRSLIGSAPSSPQV